MMNKTCCRKVMAVFVAVTTLSFGSARALATPRVGGAELSVFGEVALNGQRAISGVTIFSESVIVTAEGSSARLSLGKLGRIELSGNTSLRLTFADKSITGLLKSGRAHFSTPAGVALTLTTSDGSVLVAGSQAISLMVNTGNGHTTVMSQSGQAELRSATVTTKIAAGEIGTSGILQSTKRDDGAEQPHGGSFWAAWLVTGSVIAAAIWVVTHEKEPHQDDLDFGGTIANPSPR
jgi:ferric-dicitrate binding protein FerR (iron transport regulator)